MGNLNQNEHISNVVDFTKLQINRYAAYHQHKESMAYAGLALFTGAAGAILMAENWPPEAWCCYRKPLAAIALTVLWFAVLIYLRFQLHRRRWAALRVAGCEHVLTKWATGHLTKENCLEETTTINYKTSCWQVLLDFIWPQKSTVRVLKFPSIYPSILINAWMEKEKKGTDALKHERLIIVAGWVLYVAMIIRTLLSS